MLVDLPWRHPPRLNEGNFLGSPRWPCPAIMLATALDNVTIYGTSGKDTPCPGHRFIFRPINYLLTTAY